MPVLLNLMNDGGDQIKMRTQAASCMVGFVRGLVNSGSEEQDEKITKQ